MSHGSLGRATAPSHSLWVRDFEDLARPVAELGTVTDVVRQLVEGKAYGFSQRGEVDLKGFDEAVRLFEVRREKAVN